LRLTGLSEAFASGLMQQRQLLVAIS